MKPSEEFKQKIKAGNIAEALTLAVSEAVELKITTWITNPEAPDTPSQQYLKTKMNILEGEIENEVAQEIIEDPVYKELCQLHFEQVKQGQKIVFNNLKSLQEILLLVENTLNQLSERTSEKLPNHSPAILAYNQDSENDNH